MRIPLRHTLIAATAALTISCSAQTAEREVFDRYIIPGDRAFPSGLAYDRASGHFFVGSAADGAIYRGHVHEPRVEVWSPDGADGRSATAGMTLDPAGRLFVNGGGTGTARVYDAADGRLLAELRGLDGGFVNEVTVAADGTAYATDSLLPVVYRITETGGTWRMEPWLDVTTTPVDWIAERHNLNGILAIGDHLLAVQSSTGRLWRIDRHSGLTVEVDLGGQTLPSGDAVVSDDGRRIYVTQGNLYADSAAQPRVAVLEMSPDLTTGRIVDSLVPPGGFLHPSQAALTEEGRLLVVNSQYNRFAAGLPPTALPFTIASLDLPGTD
ncbi:hypothetical protein IU501_31180 [Nocardia otitidiscaviarum]|uniref:SMP-30/gluconolactonase/LRE family protein n=1 Tax=Nocardia otitidiscaviarum TaxID=1823 RepID=UPI000693BA39|nr:hypothetical protein [Nocardia otitidiscaviarum]MBF6137440.1 hypothetical protein [Nocardia otitidiscaviarum]MBF6488298.1 hypothetical protein [Nocardia otitidiscaviarum]